MNEFVQTFPLNRSTGATADTPWENLYKTGGAAALVMAVFLPIQILVFFVSPPPSTVIDWFALFQKNQLFGLLDLDLLLVVDQILTILVFLAVYAALRYTASSFMVIGTVLGIVSTILFIASNPAFEMLSLSNQYAAAGTEAQKTVFLAAGQAMLATWQGSAFQVSYFIGSIAAIVISAVMLRSKHFSKTTAYMGILSNSMALGLYVPKVGVYISVFSVVFLWVWYILIGLRLIQMGKVGQHIIKVTSPELAIEQ